jgi:hypothetical protein
LLFEGGYGPVDKDQSGVHRGFEKFADLPPLVRDVGRLRMQS